MELNITLWDNAEIDFRAWMSNPVKKDDELNYILRATILFNRKRFRSALAEYLVQPFKFFEKSSLIREPDLIYESISDIRFRPATPIDKKLADEREADSKKRNLKKNEQIINALLNNVSSVIQKLYEEEYPAILRMVKFNSGDEDMARDIFQESLLVIIENVLFKKVELTDSFGSYLHGISRNLWLNQLKKQKRNIRIDIENPHIIPDFSYLDDDDFQVNEEVFAIIESLGTTCKKLLEYYYYRNMSWEAIAEQLGYATAGSAKNQKYKCLEKIRKELVGK
jgi:RNA polymerase sigma factor (sigma-70 family)